MIGERLSIPVMTAVMDQRFTPIPANVAVYEAPVFAFVGRFVAVILPRLCRCCSCQHLRIEDARHIRTHAHPHPDDPHDPTHQRALFAKKKNEGPVNVP